MTFKNYRAPLRCYLELCASFCTHWWIQTWATVQKRPNLGQNRRLLFIRVTFKLDKWPWKTKAHLFYATASFVHHFLPVGEFKLALQSGNAQFGSNSTIYFSCVTVKFYGWPWKTIGHLFNFCASFRTHWWIQTWVTVRKRPIWVEIDDFF